MKIPINNGIFSDSMLNDTCSLSVKDNIQGADLTILGKGPIVIYDGDRENNEWVKVYVKDSGGYGG